MVSIKDIYWAAGFIDGEGWFESEDGMISIKAKQVCPDPLIKLQKLFGGSLYDRPLNYEWYLGTSKAAGLVMTLYPMFSAKRREQIRKCLAKWYKCELPANGEPGIPFYDWTLTKDNLLNNIYWLSGLYEGEGNCSVNNTTCRFNITQKIPELLERAKALFGGSIFHQDKSDYSRESDSSKNSLYWDGTPANALMMTTFNLLSTKRRDEIKTCLSKWKSTPLASQKHFELFNRCANGHELTPENIFIRKSSRTSGKVRLCHTCLKASKRAWHNKNKDRINANIRARYN